MRNEIADPALCAANDLLWKGDKLLVSLDREHCPGWSFDERVLGARKSRVVEIDPSLQLQSYKTIAEDLGFANGLTEAFESTTAIAETRARRLYLMSTNAPVHSVATPGAPDNLSASHDGIIAALQPNLIRFGLYRYGRRSSAPSRIANWSPENGWRMLYEDPTGAQFSGATIAVMPTPDLLIAGSVRAAGLLVCRKEGA